MPNNLFLVTSTREPDHLGSTEWLARQAAARAPIDRATNLAASRAHEPAAVRRSAAYRRHLSDAEGDLRTLLDATMACTDLVLVTPVYWYSFPQPEDVPRPMERLAAGAGAGFRMRWRRSACM